MKRLAIISSIITTVMFDIVMYEVCGLLWMIPMLPAGMYSSNEVINFFLDIYSWVLLYNYPAIGIAYIVVKLIQQRVGEMCTRDEQIECVINILMSIITCQPLAMIRLKDIDPNTAPKPTDDAIDKEDDKKIGMLIDEYKKMCSKIAEEMNKEDIHDIGGNNFIASPAHSPEPGMNEVINRHMNTAGDKLTDVVKDKHVDKQNPAAAHDVKATYDFISAVGPSAIAPSP